MNQSSLVCARPSDLPCLAPAQDQLQPTTFDQQQVLGRTLETTTLSSRFFLGTFVAISPIARHAVTALVSLQAVTALVSRRACGVLVAFIALHASTLAASHGCIQDETSPAKLRLHGCWFTSAQPPLPLTCLRHRL